MSQRKFLGSILVGGVVAGAIVALAAPQALAATSKCPDYDGPSFMRVGRDAGIAQPTRTVGGKANAGAIEIRDVCSPAHKAQAVQLPTPHAGDRFGRSSVATDITKKGSPDYPDLIVGIPGYDVGSKHDAGAIAIFLSSSKGLTFSKLLTQDSAGIAGSAQAGAHFGSTVASDFVFDENPITIRVGIPDLDIGSAKDAGGVVDIKFDNENGKITTSRGLTENSVNVPGTAEAGDRFGAALGSIYSVGVPGKKVNGHAGAGAVITGPGYPGSVLYTQDSPCVAGGAETGDHFGTAIAGNFVGVPGEDVGSKADAGMVNHLGDSDTNCYSITQDSAGVPGAAEAGDHFGATLGQEYVDYDDGYGGPEKLFIGAPGEDTSVKDAGTATVVSVTDSVDGGNAFEVYGIVTVPNPHAVAGGAFGASISATTRTGALIGAPGESGGRAYLFDTHDDSAAGAPELTRVAGYSQSTGTKSSGFGSGFTSYAQL